MIVQLGTPYLGAALSTIILSYLHSNNEQCYSTRLIPLLIPQEVTTYYNCLVENVGIEPLYSIPTAVCIPLHFILHMVPMTGLEPVRYLYQRIFGA